LRLANASHSPANLYKKLVATLHHAANCQNYLEHVRFIICWERWRCHNNRMSKFRKSFHAPPSSLSRVTEPSPAETVLGSCGVATRRRHQRDSESELGFDQSSGATRDQSCDCCTVESRHGRCIDMPREVAHSVPSEQQRPKPRGPNVTLIVWCS
jgi:hypothetical protein